MDITDVTMEAFCAPGCEGERELKGYAILPKLETKTVVIPSPPTTSIVPINPRLCVIYLSDAPITPESACLDAAKAYAKENNAVLLCPERAGADELMGVYQWAFAPAEFKRLNLKRGVIAVKADEASLACAEALTELLEDEEVEPDEAEILAF